MSTLVRFGSVLAFILLTAPTTRAHDEVAADMAAAAQRWLATLSPEQQSAGQFTWESDQRQNFHFVPDKFIQPEGKRFGLPIKQMTSQQRTLAQGLLSIGLSHKAYLQATTIMALETVLHDMENKNPIRDPEFYYLSIFGKPSLDKNWAWRFEGHHVSLQFTLVNGHLFSVTPSFMGSNPAEVRQGPLKGLRVLAEEEDMGRRLMMSLSEEQRKNALLEGEVPKDVITGQDRKINKGVFFPAKGISFDKLNAKQQQMLVELIRVYTGKYRTEVLEQINSRANTEETKDLYFAWAGSLEPGKGHYYRVQSPKYIFEYDNTQNDANHIHAVWREFDGDFGEDLLRRHYDTTAHGK